MPACLVALAVASAAFACAFYFRGQDGDYSLYYVEIPELEMNEYVPADASRSLVFPRLPLFLAGWALAVGVGWLAAARALARRNACRLTAALARTASSFTPLIALLIVPAHHAFGWPMTLAPVFLMIMCVGLCVAAMAYHMRPAFAGAFARAAFSAWGVGALCVACAGGFAFLLLRQYWGLHLGFMDSGMFAESVYH
ncbi:hypothetical protein HQ576_17625, partial [bacterium]|nr:hypothetical protein [bacterium]